jgi:hypothetical protein
MGVVMNLLSIFGFIISGLFVLTYIFLSSAKDNNDNTKFAKVLCLIIITWSFLTSCFLWFYGWKIVS